MKNAPTNYEYVVTKLDLKKKTLHNLEISSASVVDER